MARIPHLTTAEFEILKVLWRLEQATVAEVRAEQTRRGVAPAYTTVMTLLGRLAAKSAVLVDRSREPFVYRAAHRRESVIGSRVRAFLLDVFDGKADSLVLHLVEDSTLSVEELRAIEKMIASSAAAATVKKAERADRSDKGDKGDKAERADVRGRKAGGRGR